MNQTEFIENNLNITHKSEEMDRDVFPYIFCLHPRGVEMLLADRYTGCQ